MYVRNAERGCRFREVTKIFHPAMYEGVKSSHEQKAEAPGRRRVEAAPFDPAEAEEGPEEVAPLLALTGHHRAPLGPLLCQVYILYIYTVPTDPPVPLPWRALQNCFPVILPISG